MTDRNLKIIKEVDLQAAHVSRSFAETYCVHELGATSCRPYHAAWATLRLFGVITGAATDDAFLERQFAVVAQSNPNARVLICGAADHGILQIVKKGFQKQDNANPRVTLLDTCSSTLKLNHWYASRIGLNITTVQSNLLDYDNKGAFDLVTTHGFLSMIPHERHLDVISCWRDLLAPGGYLIFAQNWRPSADPVRPIRFNSNQIERFSELAGQAWLARLDLQHSIPFDEFVALAREFAAAKVVNQAPNPDEMVRLLQSVYLREVSCKTIERRKLFYRSSNPPGTDDHAVTLNVVARRPNAQVLANPL